MLELHRSIAIAILPAAFAVSAAHAQVQVQVKSPSDAFTAAFEAGDLRKALPLIEPDAKACIAAAGGDKATVDSLDSCVLLLAYYGMALSENGRSIEAVPIARRAVDVAATFGVESEVSLVANFFYGLVLERQGRNADAEEPFRLALEGAEKLLGDDPALASYVARRGNNLVMLGKFAEGLVFAERAIRIAGDTVDGNFFRLTQANALMALGRLGEAEATLRTGIARLAALTSPASAEVVSLQQSLALCLEKQNRTDEAIALWRQTLVARRAAGDEAGTADSLTGLGVALVRRGDLREAEPVLREALTIRLRLFGETSNLTGLAYSNVGLVLMESGRNDEAGNMFLRAVSVLNASGGANPDELVTVMGNLATVLTRTGGLESAVSIQRQVLQIAVTSFGAGHARTVLIRNNLAVALLKLRQRAEAIDLLKTNYAAATDLGAEAAQLRVMIAGSLGTALEEAGDMAAARMWFGRAERDSRTAFSADHSQRINIAWRYGRFMMGQPAGLPLARTLLRDAGRQVLTRAGGGAGFDARAQQELSDFTIVFRDQVRADWQLSAGAGK
ncbi:tetratricopeptide repeat protein [Sphingomonas sp.]|uniref:tetratricopeptide repeat protein n=1 Tax=Sphingomonas sp. TaxID=28214 RepID=UPI001ED65BCE|nr:tetratricopeptide repeat protein [Sphingomonas sp.]MBX3594689.1 tetratricopeptide repeat protein [Sphingomonas sp.]